MGLQHNIIKSINGLPQSAKSVQFLSVTAEKAAKNGTPSLPLSADTVRRGRTTRHAIVDVKRHSLNR